MHCVQIAFHNSLQKVSVRPMRLSVTYLCALFQNAIRQTHTTNKYQDLYYKTNCRLPTCNLHHYMQFHTVSIIICVDLLARQYTNHITASVALDTHRTHIKPCLHLLNKESKAARKTYETNYSITKFISSQLRSVCSKTNSRGKVLALHSLGPFVVFLICKGSRWNNQNENCPETEDHTCAWNDRLFCVKFQLDLQCWVQGCGLRTPQTGKFSNF